MHLDERLLYIDINAESWSNLDRAWRLGIALYALHYNITTYEMITLRYKRDGMARMGSINMFILHLYEYKVLGCLR